MLGGEHLRERFSERAQGLQNQPKHRGYLPATHLRTGDGGGYGTKTLQGNWVEERRDASYYDGKPALPTELDRTWQSTYGSMTANGVKPPPAQTLTQATMIEVVDAERRAFPGHQPQIDPSREATAKATFNSTCRTTFLPPAEVRAMHQEHVPPVKGGTPGAQGRGVLLRVRHRLQHSGQANLIAVFRRHLVAADTAKEGYLNSKELQRGCQSCNIPLDDTETSVVIKALDKTGNGYASISDIVLSVRGEFAERRASVSEKAFKLVSRVCGGVLRFKRMTELYDASQHPDVVSGKQTVEAARAYFVNQWDAKSDDEVVEKSEFLQCYADWSFEINSDPIFEIMVRNTWHLSGGEGKCENTSCRRVQVVHTNGRVTKEEIKDDLGVGDNVDKIRANLEAQGIHDISKIEMIY